jgi:Response regulators consisting of a CheY-like receiver domain and a winged-helix DNA-binding domain
MKASTSGSEAFLIVNGPSCLDEAPAEVVVMPAEDFLLLRPNAFASAEFIAYGPVSLMDEVFALGCGDFLREPWSLPELYARAGRLRRRKLSIGAVKFELDGKRLESSFASISLTEREAQLLCVLLRNAPLPVPKTVLLSLLFNDEQGKDYSLNRCVSSLRRKLDRVDPSLGRAVRTVRGLGYRLDILTCA